MGANATVVEQAYAAFGRGDIASVIAALADDVDWHSPGTLPHGGTFHGPDGVTKFFEGIGAQWENLGLTVEAVSEIANDLVAGVVRADGTRRGGGAAGYGASHVFTIRNGKIAGFREYVDIDEAL